MALAKCLDCRFLAPRASGLWLQYATYAAKFDPFLSLDCAPAPSTLAQSRERKGSNYAIWQHCPRARGHEPTAVSLLLLSLSGRHHPEVDVSARIESLVNRLLYLLFPWFSLLNSRLLSDSLTEKVRYIHK